MHVLGRVKTDGGVGGVVTCRCRFGERCRMPATPAGAATSASTVTIADLCSCTGPEASSISQTTATMQAWASWVNSHGGLAGHQVHLVVLDDGYSAGQGPGQCPDRRQPGPRRRHLRQQRRGPVLRLGGRAAKVPVLGGQETDSGWQNSDFFPAGATFNYTNSVGAIVAKNAGVKKMAALYCVEVAICAESVPQGKQVARTTGSSTSIRRASASPHPTTRRSAWRPSSPARPR